LVVFTNRQEKNGFPWLFVGIAEKHAFTWLLDHQQPRKLKKNVATIGLIPRSKALKTSMFYHYTITSFVHFPDI
jgi:hypothetical protein